MALRIALFEPDIPQNAGAILRLCACLGAGADLIEPAGFVWDDRKLKRAGMDYLEQVDLVRHASFQAFESWRAKTGRRLVLLSTQGEASPYAFAFGADDILMVGRESAGVSPEAHLAADARLRLPMRPGLRSLNVALAASITLAEALRQTGQLP
jgi:tRNA (cytidine/uridine-2'-O-)-methyltransferase